MNLRNVKNSSADSYQVALSGKLAKAKYYDDPASMENYELTSVHGEVIRSQDRR